MIRRATRRTVISPRSTITISKVNIWRTLNFSRTIRADRIALQQFLPSDALQPRCCFEILDYCVPRKAQKHRGRCSNRVACSLGTPRFSGFRGPRPYRKCAFSATSLYIYEFFPWVGETFPHPETSHLLRDCGRQRKKILPMQFFGGIFLRAVTAATTCHSFTKR